MNIKLLVTNVIDSAQIIGNPAFDENYPARYMKLLSRSKSARTTSAANQSIIVDWAGENKSIDSVIVAGHNITEWGTMRCKLFEDLTQSGDTLYDSGVLAAASNSSIGDALGWNDTIFWLDSTVSVKSMQIDISDPYSVDGYVSIRRLFAGVVLTPDINFSKGINLSINDNTVFQRTKAGTLYSQNKATYRSLSFELPYLPDIDAVNWIAELLQSAKKTDYYVAAFPEDAVLTKRYSHSFIAKLESDASFVCAYPNAKTFQVNLVEA